MNTDYRLTIEEHLRVETRLNTHTNINLMLINIQWIAVK